METLTAVMHHQVKHAGLIYTIKVQATNEHPEKILHFEDQLKKQFLDIAENHAALEVKKIDAVKTLKLIEEHAKEARQEKREVSKFRKGMTP
jgi:hypothetical protein